MKTCTLYFSLLLLFNCMSCKDSGKTVETIPEVEEVPNIERNAVEDGAMPPKKYCYLYAVDKDSVWLNLTHINDQINGDMRYKFYQIDGSLGTFTGVLKGDTIRGMYDFKAEGTNSKRELIFLQKNGMLVEGKGNTEVSGNTESFKENASFTFKDGRVLKSVDCKSGTL